MKTQHFMVLAAGLFLAGCGENASRPGSSTNSATSGNPLNAPAEYVGALGRAQQSAVKTADLTSLKQAIQLFGVDKGRNPTDLDELVKEKFIPRIPDAPYGMKIAYDPPPET